MAQFAPCSLTVPRSVRTGRGSPLSYIRSLVSRSKDTSCAAFSRCGKTFSGPSMEGNLISFAGSHDIFAESVWVVLRERGEKMEGSR